MACLVSKEPVQRGECAPAEREQEAPLFSEEEQIRCLQLATGNLKRARGLLFTLPHKRTIILLPCKDVHTAGMVDPLDIAFVGADGRVLESHCCVEPFRRFRNARAVGVLERFAYEKTPWFQKGDRIGLCTVKGEHYENLSGM